EDQAELVVLHGSLDFPTLDAGLARRVHHRTELFVQLPAPGRPAKVVDGLVPSGGHDPSRRVGWDAAPRPVVAGHDECLLDRVFGERDVAEDPDQRRDGLSIRLAEDAVDTDRIARRGDGGGHARRRPVARNGQTSIGWLMASTTFRAHTSAASKSSALMM